jgi:hypothetical protein
MLRDAVGRERYRTLSHRRLGTSFADDARYVGCRA